MLQGLKRVLLGVGHDPLVVSAARATVYVVAPVLVDWLVMVLTGSTNPVVLSVAPSISGLLRVLEGAIDRQLKPDQNKGDAGQ